MSAKDQCFLFEGHETNRILAQLDERGPDSRLAGKFDTDGKVWVRAVRAKGSPKLSDDEAAADLAAFPWINRSHVCPPEPPENCQE